MSDFKWGARRLSDEQQRAADEWFEDRGATHEARQDRFAAENARRRAAFWTHEEDEHRISAEHDRDEAKW